jgi:hypothetical protein
MIDDSQNVTIFVQIQLEAGIRPVVNLDVTLIPKPDKSEYRCTRLLIEEWAQEFTDNSEFGTYPEPSSLRNVMLNPREFCNRTLMKGEIEETKVLLLVQRRMNWMLAELNNEQVLTGCKMYN